MAKKYFLQDEHKQDEHKLNLRSYRSYDENFLLNKVLGLFVIVNRQNEFEKLFEEQFGSPEHVDKKFMEALRAEIYFTEFHQFEAFFAILIAVFQALPHWLYLTTYPSKEIKNKVNAFLSEDIGTLTNRHLDNINDFLNIAIYAEFMTTEQEKKDKWQTNLDNIKWVLRRMAQKYIDGPEYNAYKHGVRVMVGPKFLRMSPSDNPSVGIHWASDNAVSFLETKDEGQGQYTVHETTKLFDPEESLNHLYFMASILETVKEARRARLEGEVDIKLNTFFEVNRENLSKLGQRTKWSFQA